MKKYILPFFATLFLFNACTKESTFLELPVYGPEQNFYAIADNSLLLYDAKSVKTPTSTLAITGLANSEKLLSIDFNVYTGELFALSNQSKIYVVNTVSGVARAISALPFKPSLTSLSASLDFDPTKNIISIITADGVELQINPESGQTIGAGTTIMPNLVATAHSNNIAGAAISTHFAIDAQNGKLYKRTSSTENFGAVGDFGLPLGEVNSFDISPDDKNALVVTKTTEGTKLYTVNLSTGQAELAGKFQGAAAIQSIAIPTAPVAYGISGGSLVYLNPNSLTADALEKPIAGLQNTETILGMDISPLNGQIYAVGSTSTLYALNPATAQATSIAAFTPALIGTAFGVDYNPAANVLAIVGNTGQKLSLSLSGVATAQTAIPLASQISTLAYSNNFGNASSTILYGIDYLGGKLVSVNANSAITEIGNTGIAITEASSFDIFSSATSNKAVLVSTDGTKSIFYNVSLTSGTITALGTINKPINSFCLGLRW